MPYTCYVWTSIVLAHVFDISNALEFIPTPTWATLRTSTFGLEILPTITAGTFQGDLKERDASQQNPICGWIGGNGGMRTYLFIQRLFSCYFLCFPVTAV